MALLWCGAARAADPVLLLGGREWTVHGSTDARDVARGEADLPGVWVENATLEVIEPLGAAARDEVFVLAATFMSEHASAKAVRYRILVRGGARFREAELLAGPARANLRALRSRMSAPTLDALDTTLREVKARAKRASQVDWTFATAQALAEVIDGSTRRDALAGVQLILKSLGDGHSWATVLDDQGRLTANGQQVPYRAPQSRLQALDDRHRVGWLTIPLLAATGGLEARTYADTIRAGLAQAVDAGACGVVVDLSGHPGGNMWPGLEGLGPLFGSDAVVGAFKPGSPWRIEKTGDDRIWRDEVAQMPVAVLVGPGTMSSGEALAVAFSGRPQTEFFGRKTRGLATSNQMVPLGDGLVAFVMTSEMADRHGRTFPNGIAPSTEDESNEEAGVRAQDWLRTQAGCR
ncbi:MAG: S41 family peptidase [Burkholderiales bacterium]|nr:S41 family peptidase [Burkholderiales bacterium]